MESGGITWLFNEKFYPYPSAIRTIRKAAEVCSFEKLMWGSDYPGTMVEITYKMSYDFVLKSEELTAEEKEAFLMYYILPRKCSHVYDMQVTGKTKVHGIEGVELTAGEASCLDKSEAINRTFAELCVQKKGKIYWE